MLADCGEVIGVVIHVVSVPRLTRSSVTSPIMGDDAIAMIQEEHHLRVPVVRTKWPAVPKHNRLSFAPVLVIDLCSVFCRDRRHTSSSYFSLIYTIGFPRTVSQLSSPPLLQQLPVQLV